MSIQRRVKGFVQQFEKLSFYNLLNSRSCFTLGFCCKRCQFDGESKHQVEGSNFTGDFQTGSQHQQPHLFASDVNSLRESQLRQRSQWLSTIVLREIQRCTWNLQKNEIVRCRLIYLIYSGQSGHLAPPLSQGHQSFSILRCQWRWETKQLLTCMAVDIYSDLHKIKEFFFQFIPSRNGRNYHHWAPIMHILANSIKNLSAVINYAVWTLLSSTPRACQKRWYSNFE